MKATLIDLIPESPMPLRLVDTAYPEGCNVRLLVDGAPPLDQLEASLETMLIGFNQPIEELPNRALYGPDMWQSSGEEKYPIVLSPVNRAFLNELVDTLDPHLHYLQLLWPDHNGKLPNDRNYDHELNPQAVLPAVLTASEALAAEDLESQREVMHAKYREHIEQYGHAIVGVFDPQGHEIPFFYTTGLARQGHPELLLIGDLPGPIAAGIINEVAAMLKPDGEKGPNFRGRIEAYLESQDGKDLPIFLQDVNPKPAKDLYMLQSEPVQDHAVTEVIQIYWPDTEGRLPNEEGFDSSKFPQPMLPALGATPTIQ